MRRLILANAFIPCLNKLYTDKRTEQRAQHSWSLNSSKRSSLHEISKL